MNLVDDLRAIETEVSRKTAEAVSDRQRNETQSTSDQSANNLNALIGLVSGYSEEEIDRVISALHDIREMLRREGERISQDIGRYASLNHAVTSGMKVISDNLEQWKHR